MTGDIRGLVARLRENPWCQHTRREAADRIEALEAEVERLRAGRDEWRNDFRALEKAVVGDTGLSAMTVAAQARLFRPKAERADAQLSEAWAGEDELAEVLRNLVRKTPFMPTENGLMVHLNFDRIAEQKAALASHAKRKERRS